MCNCMVEPSTTDTTEPQEVEDGQQSPATGLKNAVQYCAGGFAGATAALILTTTYILALFEDPEIVFFRSSSECSDPGRIPGILASSRR